MRRFRTQWLALFGALVILGMSLSSAFAAKPTTSTTTDAVTNFGQQVSTFVHLLLFGDEEDGDQDEDEARNCEAPSDEEADEAAEEGTDAEDDTADECEDGDADEDIDEDTGEPDEDGAGDADEESELMNHGQCVADVARSDEVGDNGTHGWAVALAAQITCWMDLNGDDTEDEVDADTDSGDEETGDETSTVQAKPHGKSESAHQRKLDRGSGKPAWAGMKAHAGHAKGHGKGHGPKH